MRIIIYFTILMVITSCTSQTNKNYKIEDRKVIIDYNQPYDYFARNMRINKNMDNQIDSYGFIINNKKVTFLQFQKLLKNKKDYKIEVIDDSKLINDLDFPPNKIKKVYKVESRLSAL